MNLFDQIILLLTGLAAAYLVWRFYGRYSKNKALHDMYYMMGFVVLFVSGVLLIFLGWDILASPYILTVATLIPLGISMGLMNQFVPQYKKAYAWIHLTAESGKSGAARLQDKIASDHLSPRELEEAKAMAEELKKRMSGNRKGK